MRSIITTVALVTLAAVTGASIAGSPAPVEPDAEDLDPSRVAALEYLETEVLLALGITPAGVADIGGYRQWVGIQSEALGDSRDLGSRQSPSLESLADLEPTLIVSSHWRHGNIAQRLTSIGPTLLYADLPQPEATDQYSRMQAIVRDLGQRLGRQAQAQQALTALDEQLASQRSRLRDSGADGAIVLAQHVQGSQRFRLFTDNSLAIRIARELGLSNGFEHAPQPHGFATVRLEDMLALPQDSHLLIVADRDDAAYQRLTDSRLWQSVPGVETERLIHLPTDTWFFGGPLSARRLADRITDGLLD
jgi:iron complex transport system substrate-binding protein